MGFSLRLQSPLSRGVEPGWGPVRQLVDPPCSRPMGGEDARYAQIWSSEQWVSQAGWLVGAQAFGRPLPPCASREIGYRWLNPLDLIETFLSHFTTQPISRCWTSFRWRCHKRLCRCRYLQSWCRGSGHHQDGSYRLGAIQHFLQGTQSKQPPSI